MSTLPDNEFDLEKLFLPAWAQEPSSAKYAHYEGTEERGDRRGDRRGPRPPRRDGAPFPRRDDNRPRGAGPRPGPGRPQGRPEGGRDRPPGPGRGPGRRPEPREHREPPPPLPEIEVSLLPDEKGVESLARQIKMTGRAYPLFDIAQMILQKPERHAAVFTVKRNPEGKPVQPLFVCALDDTLWLSEGEAASHVLRKHFATFYAAQRTPKEPPKGTYTFVAQCGISGVILGPPNHHDYQNQLRKLHSERFSRMPLEAFKARVRIVRDPEVVKKWVEDQSWRTEYDCLNLPEPLRLASMEEVETHFRQTHKENIIKSVESHTLTGAVARALRSQDLLRLVRSAWEDQRRFPLQMATVLSQMFAGHGLQFFKVNKTVTHVCVTRPHHLDLAAAPVSEGVRRIVDYINARNRCSRRDLVEALAPSPAPAPIPIPIPTPVPAAPPAPTPESAAPAAPATEAAASAAAPASEAAAPAPAPSPQPAANQPTPEQTVVIADLHWLIHQGHVIEFASGLLETAKKPAPKPPKPEVKPAPADTTPAAPAEVAMLAEAAAAPAEALPAAEGAVSEPAPTQEGASAPTPEHLAAEVTPESPQAVDPPAPEPQPPAGPACSLAEAPEALPLAALEPPPEPPPAAPAPAAVAEPAPVAAGPPPVAESQP